MIRIFEGLNRLLQVFIRYIRLIRIIRESIYLHLRMQHAEEDLQVRWLKLRIRLKERFGIKPDMNGVLLLIGVQELGQGPQQFNKEQKQDLMHIAICTILMPSGYYTHDGLDDEGWPHFTPKKTLPELYLNDQENFLKDHVLLYFQNQGFI